MKRVIIICTAVVAALIVVGVITVLSVARQAHVDAQKTACAEKYTIGTFLYITCIERANS